MKWNNLGKPGPSVCLKAANTILAYHPTWAICLSLKQAELIVKDQSNLYSSTAKWLSLAKKAYQIKGQTNDWQTTLPICAPIMPGEKR